MIINNTMSFTLDDKIKILEYLDQNGVSETLRSVNTFGKYSISRATLFRWKKERRLLVQDHKPLRLLAPRSKKPKMYRQREYDLRISEYIILCRRQYKNIGKEKLKLFVDEYCLENNIKTVSVSTVGRILNDLKKYNRIPKFNESKEVYLDGGDGKIRVRIIKKKKHRLRKPKDMKASHVGDIVQLDAITYHIGGVKRYLINCIDLYSRVAFSYPCTSLNSANARKTIQEFQTLLNVPIVHVQTDNGLENHKHFDEYLSKSSILHFWNNPRSPKQNAYIERFNRTIEEEFADWNLLSFKSSILDDFKVKLKNYLQYYNYKRPHYSLQYKTPMSILHQLDDQKSQM